MEWKNPLDPRAKKPEPTPAERLQQIRDDTARPPQTVSIPTGAEAFDEEQGFASVQTTFGVQAGQTVNLDLRSDPWDGVDILFVQVTAPGFLTYAPTQAHRLTINNAHAVPLLSGVSYDYPAITSLAFTNVASTPISVGISLRRASRLHIARPLAALDWLDFIPRPLRMNSATGALLVQQELSQSRTEWSSGPISGLGGSVNNLLTAGVPGGSVVTLTDVTGFSPGTATYIRYDYHFGLVGQVFWAQASRPPVEVRHAFCADFPPRSGTSDLYVDVIQTGVASPWTVQARGYYV